MYLKGDPAAMQSKAVLFNVDKCDSDKRQKEGKSACANDLSTYVKDIMVDNWVMYKKMNFTDKLGEPNFYANDIYDSVMLNDHPDHVIQRNYMYLR